jgi:hypothetical protein
VSIWTAFCDLGFGGIMIGASSSSVPTGSTGTSLQAPAKIAKANARTNGNFFSFLMFLMFMVELVQCRSGLCVKVRFEVPERDL